jgi:hypothetical protein
VEDTKIIEAFSRFREKFAISYSKSFGIALRCLQKLPYTFQKEWHLAKMMSIASEQKQ